MFRRRFDTQFRVAQGERAVGGLQESRRATSPRPDDRDGVSSGRNARRRFQRRTGSAGERPDLRALPTSPLGFPSPGAFRAHARTRPELRRQRRLLGLEESRRFRGLKPCATRHRRFLSTQIAGREYRPCRSPADPAPALIAAPGWSSHCRAGPRLVQSAWVQRAEHALGFHFAASGSCFQFVLVTKGSLRYWGSSTTVVTTNQVSPLRSLDKSKYSLRTVLAL